MSSSSPGRPRSLNRLSQNRTVASHRPILAAISGALRPCSTACRTILRPANKAGTERARARHPCQLVGFVIAQRPHPKGHDRAPEQNQALPQRAEDQKAANNLPDAPLSSDRPRHFYIPLLASLEYTSSASFRESGANPTRSKIRSG